MNEPVPPEYSHLRFDASIGEFSLKKAFYLLMAVLMAVNRRINGWINTRSWRYRSVGSPLPHRSNNWCLALTCGSFNTRRTTLLFALRLDSMNAFP